MSDIENMVRHIEANINNVLNNANQMLVEQQFKMKEWHDAMGHGFADMSNERAALAAEVQKLNAERAALADEMTKLADERVALAAEMEKLTVERARAEQAAQALRERTRVEVDLAVAEATYKTQVKRNQERLSSEFEQRRAELDAKMESVDLMLSNGYPEFANIIGDAVAEVEQRDEEGNEK